MSNYKHNLWVTCQHTLGGRGFGCRWTSSKGPGCLWAAVAAAAKLPVGAGLWTAAAKLPVGAGLWTAAAKLPEGAGL